MRVNPVRISEYALICEMHLITRNYGSVTYHMTVCIGSWAPDNDNDYYVVGLIPNQHIKTK